MIANDSSASGLPSGPLTYSGPVIAAVIPDQPEGVIRHAAALASSFGTGLVCAYVDMSCYTARNYRDGVERFIPINPDSLNGFDQGTVDRIQEELERRLAGTTVRWSLRGLAGEPAHELSILADRLDASMIVVGTRRPGLSKRLEELVEGSVAAHLAHHQSRPVVVIPLHPHRYGGGR
ncbi:hypothetical protein ASH00_14610 [Arthrobacter sp. Soil782]|uniref:universal stress protein n=1 Tax=Arthrobacter sp. Soil782 TaxID=1736410 RepID=UPI0006F749FB|nr:universal stress protein [Arthrobacter sp. Soil782]KRF04332.1 hypothetical protein ASH00_14610 [Arthrobacter sp. Soil782]